MEQNKVKWIDPRIIHGIRIATKLEHRKCRVWYSKSRKMRRPLRLFYRAFRDPPSAYYDDQKNLPKSKNNILFEKSKTEKYVVEVCLVLGTEYLFQCEKPSIGFFPILRGGYPFLGIGWGDSQYCTPNIGSRAKGEKRDQMGNLIKIYQKRAYVFRGTRKRITPKLTFLGFSYFSKLIEFSAYWAIIGPRREEESGNWENRPTGAPHPVRPL